jgi:crotonobetainyl-CoA:carnitine CoA-transferase CaiB-like acyl-CoA transferase
VHALWPRLVSAAISGYGQEGPYRDRKAYDLLVQSESGVAWITGSPAEPARVGVSIADIGGGLYLLASILAALRQRDRDGEGRRIDVALLDCLAEWMSVAWYFEAYAGGAPPRAGMRHNTISPYGAFRCADGYVTLAVQTERTWSAFCELVLERSELAGDPRFATNELRHAHRAELEAIVEEIFSAQTRRGIEAKLEAADVPFGALNTVADLVAHPQLATRDRWTEVETPGGRVRALRPPFAIGGIEPRMAGVPALDADGDAIRREVR